MCVCVCIATQVAEERDRASRRFQVLEVTRKALQAELDSLKVGGGSMQRALMTNIGAGDSDDSDSD